MLYRWFREKGWKLSGNPGADVCPACVEKTRQKHREDRRAYVNGSADRLIEGIRLVDQLMTGSVTQEMSDRQPDVAAAMRSLIETAFLCNMLTREDIPADIRPSMPPEPPRPEYRKFSDQIDEVVPSHIASMPTHAPLPENTHPISAEIRESPLPEPPPPEPKPEPPPEPKREPEQIHPRTAAYLTEMRRTILGEGAKR